MSRNCYSDATYMSADDKAKTAKQFITFLKSGCSRKTFTSRIYKHAHLHCGFAAHYNIEGFYQEYFWGLDEGGELVRARRHKGVNEFLGAWEGTRAEELDWGRGMDYKDLNEMLKLIIHDFRDNYNVDDLISKRRKIEKPIPPSIYKQPSLFDEVA